MIREEGTPFHKLASVRILAVIELAAAATWVLGRFFLSADLANAALWAGGICGLLAFFGLFFVAFRVCEYEIRKRDREIAQGKRELRKYPC